jgi:hypothetical protein
VRNKSAIEKRAEQLTSNQIEKYYKPANMPDENSASGSTNLLTQQQQNAQSLNKILLRCQ